MKTFFSCIRSIVLILFGLMALIAAIKGLGDAATLWQARNWPVVAARVDQCSMYRHYGKHDSWWEVSATFSYGSGFDRHYQESWTPPDSPRYSRGPDPVVSEHDEEALTKRFCDRAAAGGLRMSADHPSFAWRSEAVETGEWKTDLGMGLGIGLAALFLIAIGALLWPGREAAMKSAKAKKQRKAAGAMRENVRKSRRTDP
ncbi:DUF3592 domain-containing protein [Paraburkholderia sediminicola]|uniref:DUF3592 domain-containing protein n=1 Tax=Paraburkholderia sediminicola TaxID=458836 RepID=UPI0038B6C481